MCGYSRDCIPQPGTPQKVDAIADRLMYRLQYRNFGTHESLVVNHTVDVGGDHAGIRWYEVRDPGGAPSIHQQSTYAPDADHRWMGSAAMDGAGDLALGFSVSSATTFPSIRYAGRLADDPLGTLPQDEATLMIGSGSQTDMSGRWGDYSSLSVDPTDHCTFWYTQEYYATTSAIGWRTRIGSFRFPSCVASGLPVVTVVATSAAATEAGLGAGTFTVSRTGNTDLDLAVTYTVRGSATAGSDYLPLTGNVTIPVGSATATIDITPINDALVEPDETVIVSVSADTAYTEGTPSTAIVNVVSDDLPPDLVIAALSAPGAGGAGAAITVTETTRNQGGGPGEASTTAFYLSTNGGFDSGDVLLGSRAVPALAPGAASAASTSVVIPAGTAVGVHYVIARADADDALTEGQENNNTSARAILIGPDLAVAALSAPTAAAAGATIAVSDTTKNQGAGAADTSTTGFYLSANSTFDAADVPLGSRAVPALAAGATSAASIPLTIPAGTAPGTYYVIARADADGIVGETKENNNTAADSVQIGADLVIAVLSVPVTAGAGATIAVGDTTKNQGGGPAGASATAFFLSTNSAFDAGDLPLGRRAVPPLAASATSSGSTSVTIPAGTAPGAYYVIARADADGVVVESQEGNNASARSILIGSDLIVAALSAPTTAAAGATITVTDTTKNQGAGTAEASTTAFYLSTNSTFDAGDVPLGGRAVPALAAGATSAASTPLALPAATAPGTYYVIARADADGIVGETKENNNTTADSVQVGPDLAITVLSAPTTTGAGTTIAVGDTTKNQGGGPAGASATALYLSTNSSLDAGDLPLGSRAVPALAAGATNAGSLSVTIPPGTAAGTYYIIARADAGGGVVESQEGNNTAARWVLVGPDLTIATLSVPATAMAGGPPITVSDTTKNQGAGAADTSTTTFYLSTNSTFDTNDVPLASRAVATLGPGATSAGATSVTIPAGTAPGTYYVVARADADDVVDETKENNNTTARTIQVQPGGPS